MRLLLDTSVLFDVLRSRHNRRALLAELVHNGHSLATSALNVAEVYAGMRPEEESRTNAFLDSLDCYALTTATARVAGRIKSRWGKKGRTLSFADAIVAAIALEHGCTLMTDNRKDFPMPEIDYYPLPEN